jgi:hypothetical protein
VDRFDELASLSERLKRARLGPSNPSLEERARLLAERFAPNVADDQPPTAPNTEHVKTSISIEPVPAKSRVSTNTWLFLLLLAISLLPPAAVAMLLWDDTSEALRGLRAVWTEEVASRVGGLLPQANEQLVRHGSAISEGAMPRLSVASRLKAAAEQEVALPIRITPADAVPPGSMVAISGLPRGSFLSHGQAIAANEWLVGADDLQDLRLTLDQRAADHLVLQIALLAPTGYVIAAAETLLEHDRTAGLITRTEEVDRIADLIERGHNMLEVGYFAGARAYFRRAAEAGSAEAALALADTYDPTYIAQSGAKGVQPDLVEARAWLERAAALGSPAAQATVRRLRPWSRVLPSQPATSPSLPRKLSGETSAISTRQHTARAVQGSHGARPIND